MDKCRICLENSRAMFSLYDFDGDISYIDMIACIASKKIIMDNQVPKKICDMCRRKLIEAFDFKTLIQRSDMILQENHNLNVINFNKLSDIKIKIEITEPNITQFHKYSTNFIEMFKNDKHWITYNDVLIRKVCTDTEKEKKPMPDLDFLKTIKNECDDNDMSQLNTQDCGLYQDCGVDNDDIYEYAPYKQIKVKKNKKKHVKEEKVSKVINLNNNICIKPVYMKNVRVMYHDKSTKVKKRYKYPPMVRKDICPFCGKITMSLKSHMLIHTGERSFKCDVCSKSYLSEQHLKSHKRKHVDIKNFKCGQCVAAFADKASLKSHMTCHSDQKNYICDVCNKGFKRKNALTRHVLIHNFGSKKINCELCSMSFYNNVGLRHHMRVHTGERPFKCEICSQPYSYKHDFNRHCFKKHGIFLKRRSIYVLNEEVLMQERALMKDLLLRTQGIMEDDKPLNPFEGPQAALAFEQAVIALTTRQIPVDL